jgi:uncharacterized membrane protein
MQTKQSVNGSHETKRISRPFGVTLLAVVVLVIAMLHLIRFYLGIRKWDLLNSLLPFSPAYLILSGLIWGIIGLVLFWGLWYGSSWASFYTLVGQVAFSVYYWLDRIFMPGYAERNLNWIFVIGINLSILGYSIWLLTRSKTKKFFGGNDE